MKKHLTNLAFSFLLSIYSMIGFSKAADIGFLKSVDRKPALVVISANWCVPCKIVHKWMEEDAQVKRLLEHYDVKHYDFDVDKNMVKKYNVDRIPFFAVVSNGKEVARKFGISTGKSGLEIFLQAYIARGSK